MTLRHGTGEGSFLEEEKNVQGLRRSLGLEAVEEKILGKLIPQRP